MNPIEVIPLLLVVLLLVSTSGADVDRMEVTFEGTHEVNEMADVLIVAGGTTTIPANRSVSGQLYVIGGSTRVMGAIDGGVTLLAGNLSVTDNATVAGRVRTVGGNVSIAEGATIETVDTVDPPTPNDSLTGRLVSLLFQWVTLGLAGWWLVGTRQRLVENVGHAITEHTLVSGTVGLLAGTALLVLFVYMAFTVVLLPISLLGLVGELVVALYGQIVFGHLIGRQLPVESERGQTVLGIGCFLLVIELLGSIPYLGALCQLGLLAVGFGAVVNTSFGLQRFKPVTIQEPV
jgi:hypothetical protein